MKKLSLLFLSILTIASCSNERKIGGGCVGDDCQATYKVLMPQFLIYWMVQMSLSGQNLPSLQQLKMQK